jgi:hypothetical protein
LTESILNAGRSSAEIAEFRYQFFAVAPRTPVAPENASFRRVFEQSVSESSSASTKRPGAARSLANIRAMTLVNA